ALRRQCAARRVKRPRERVGRADAGGALPDSAPGDDCRGWVAVVGLEQRLLDSGVDAAGFEQLRLRLDQRQVTAGGGVHAGGLLGFGGGGGEFGRRQQGDRLPVIPDRLA